MVDLQYRPGRHGLLSGLVSDRASGSRIDTCYGCGACSNACPVSGLEGMDPCRLVQTILLGQDEAAINTGWIWHCCRCGRCDTACPMGIEVSSVIHLIKSLHSLESVPEQARRVVDVWVSTGNTRGIHPKAFLEACLQARDGYRRITRDRDYQIPVDRPGSDLLLLADPQLVVGKPQILTYYAMILEQAGISWTLSSHCLGTVDMAVTLGLPCLEELWMARLSGLCRDLGAGAVLVDDCQNPLSMFGPGSKSGRSVEGFRVLSLPLLLKECLVQNRMFLKGGEDRPVVVQWPCSHGEDFAEAVSGILSAVCTGNGQGGAARPIEYCCGGGLGRCGLSKLGGRFLEAMKEAFRQAGEGIFVALCSSCYLQMKAVTESMEDMGSKTETVFFPEFAARMLA